MSMLRNTFKTLTNFGGYPYFYKARRVRYPYIYRNPIIGNALAGNFLIGYQLYQGLKKRFISTDGPKYADFLNEIKSPLNTTRPSRRWKTITDTPTNYPKITNLSGKIAVWIYDEYATQDTGGGPYLTFDFVPEELKFDVPSTLKSVGIIGLNYPRYHYVGSEETLTMTIDWYDFPANRDSVVVKCRKLEALSKANGDESGPLPIYIDWGNYYHWRGAEGKLLTGHVYTIQSASYKLTNFTLNREIAQRKPYSNTTLVNNALYPLQATQELILKREAPQLTRNQITYGFI